MPVSPLQAAGVLLSAAIEPETDLGSFVENDYAVIEHVLTVEDNQGSYTVRHETEIELSGPEQAVENWREHNQANA